jgi:hypothetical protein
LRGKKIINIENKRTVSSDYKPIQPPTNDYRKGNYDNQTDNKENHRNINMSMGLGKEKKSKASTKDQNEEKPSLPKKATTSSPLPPPQSELFDSSSDNAMSEMKQVAYMRTDEASKVFSHLEEKQQLDPSAKSTDDSVKETDPKKSLTTRPDIITDPVMAEQSQQEREQYSVQSIEGQVMVPKHDEVPDIAQIHSESQDHEDLNKSVTVYNNENSVFYSNSDSPNYDNYDPFIIGIRFWQAHTIGWFSAYNGFLKAWVDNIKLTRLPCENS